MTVYLSVLGAIIGTAIVGASSNAHADFSRYSCQAPSSGPVQAIVDDNACVGFHVVASDGSIERTVAFPFKGSGRLIASTDGRTVVMLQSHLDGTIDDQGNVVESGDPDVVNPVGVRIYRDGALVRTHRIHDLVVRTSLLTRSISHVDWVRESPAEITGSTFSLGTTSFRTITFDVTSGKIRTAKDSPVWKRCDDIVRGSVDLANSRLKDAYSLKTGKHTATVPFERDPAAGLTDKAWTTVCLEKSGASSLVLTQTL